MTNISDLTSANGAAQFLADQLGGAREHWVTWLANDRRPGRAGLLPPAAGPGRPKYHRAALEAFVESERAKRLRSYGPSGRAQEVMKAFGIGEEGGSRTGRRLDCQVMGQLDEATNRGFVQLQIASPLLVYRLSSAQARTLAAELQREAEDADHMESIVSDGERS